MPFDTEKDELIQELGPIGDTGMYAEIRCYDGGEQKLAILKTVGQKGKVRSVCRLSLDVVNALGLFLVDLDFVTEDGDDGG